MFNPHHSTGSTKVPLYVIIHFILYVYNLKIALLYILYIVADISQRKLEMPLINNCRLCMHQNKSLINLVKIVLIDKLEKMQNI